MKKSKRSKAVDSTSASKLKAELSKKRDSISVNKLQAELWPILLDFVHRYGRVEVLTAATRLLFLETRGRNGDPENTFRRVQKAYTLMKEAKLAGKKLEFERAARNVADKDFSQSVDGTVKTMRRLHDRLSCPPAMADRQTILSNLDKTEPSEHDMFFGSTLHHDKE